MSQEITKILMEEWLREWLGTLSHRDPALAWDTELVTCSYAVEKFLKWVEENK